MHETVARARFPKELQKAEKAEVIRVSARWSTCDARAMLGCNCSR